ncbi:transcriptional regulator, LytTR family [Bradyrhizobium lablabi]|uniref:Transcriptional regulator, LytTR family n=1 Tax=Bradyrhizobium lablabi TaxID=722472 RepID=A0A1M7BWJ7_9BRAD|nr:LytTR family DNA-binding domain-containing protein [Bradyrhizobium lablabi]SHL59307.1 transcriptional regulator, LytTR family [Bradyrhizobium lablabi]
MIKSLIQLAPRSPVHPPRDGWFRPRDEKPGDRTSGGTSWTKGVDAQLSVRAVYAVAATLVAVSCLVGAFSNARDISWRLGSPHNLWEPALWEATSGIVVVALLPLIRRGALLFRAGGIKPFTTGATLIALVIAFSALHIIGMGLLRELAYRLAGWTYTFPWSREILYEFRKDLFAYLALAVIFWFAERPARAAPIETGEAAPKRTASTPAKPELWLRDGRISVLIDACEIVSVSSAGNYVEYELTAQRKHLIRTTLQAEEARLAPFGIARVHRSRLINLKRIVALQWRPSGDFEVRLDTGETVPGSRRFKAAVAGIAERSKAAAAGTLGQAAE